MHVHSSASVQCDLFEVYITEAVAQLAHLQKACVRLVSLDAVLFGALAGTHRGAASALAALRGGKSNTPASLSGPPAVLLTTLGSNAGAGAGAGKQRAAQMANDSDDDDEDAVDIPDNDNDSDAGGGAAQIRMTSPSTPSSRGGSGRYKPNQKQQLPSQAAPAGWGTSDPFAASETDSSSSGFGTATSIGIVGGLVSSSRHAHQEAIDLCLVHFSVVHRELTRALAMMRDHLNAVIRVQGANGGGGGGASAARSTFGTSQLFRQFSHELLVTVGSAMMVLCSAVFCSALSGVCTVYVCRLIVFRSFSIIYPSLSHHFSLSHQPQTAEMRSQVGGVAVLAGLALLPPHCRHCHCQSGALHGAVVISSVTMTRA